MKPESEAEPNSELFAPELPGTAYVRLDAIIGKRGKRGVLPISRSAFYAGIKSGRFRQPTHIGPHTVAWPVAYVRELLAALAAQSPE